MGRPRYEFKDVLYPKIAVVPDQATANARLDPSTVVLIKTELRAKSIKMLCPCGCGSVLSINLMREAGKAWKMVCEGTKGVSLYPSVWLDVGCQAHFVLRRNVARLILGRVPRPSDDEIDSWWG
jgi:hypothetical protein